MFKLPAVCFLTLAALQPWILVAGDPLVVHEWGTFTALQDDNGAAIGAINSDDEPVPDFVCKINGIATVTSRQPAGVVPGVPVPSAKGVSRVHPDVTMRLETPVIYFYPPPSGWTAPIDARVEFHGGWLTEYYPRAVATAPGLLNTPAGYPPLTPESTGSLAWNGIELGAKGTLTSTDDPVWTAPREVARAAVVRVPAPPGLPDDAANRPEKFLFYRGVAHLDSPLRVVSDAGADRLRLYPGRRAAEAPAHPGEDLRVSAAWLIEIRASDGFCAFRPVGEPLDLNAPAGELLAALPAGFASDEFAGARIKVLRFAMRDALTAAGLFPDEAAAMLKTWELSYFRSPGRRVFYLTPHAWTERVLPLTIHGAEITRVMMGRIELVTPGQRERLARLAAGPCPDFARWNRDAVALAAAGTGRANSTTGRFGAAESKVRVPPLYQDYLDLGRFRDALLLNENRSRYAAPLAAFIADQSREAVGKAEIQR